MTTAADRNWCWDCGAHSDTPLRAHRCPACEEAWRAEQSDRAAEQYAQPPVEEPAEDEEQEVVMDEMYYRLWKRATGRGAE